MKETKKTIGVLPTCNWGGLEILEINCEYVVACFNFGHGREIVGKHTIIYTSAGKAYFRKQGHRYYLNEIQWVA